MRSGWIAGIVLAAAVAVARADVVVLVDGTRVDARLLEIDAANVRFAKKGEPEETKPRADVAAVLFYEQAKGAPPASAATDRVELDDLAVEGALVRITREKLGYFGLTRLAVLEAGTGALRTVVTTRRIGSIRIGKPQPKAKPPATKPGAAPLKPGDAVSAAFKTLKPTDDVPAVIFGAEAVAATLTDEFAKKRIAGQVETAKKLLPQHESLHLTLSQVEVDTDKPHEPGEDFGRPSSHDTGSGVYVYAHLAATTGELLGPVVRFAWKTKSGKTGCTAEQYFTKTAASEHVCHLGMSIANEFIDDVAVEVLEGKRIVGERELKFDRGAWAPAAAAPTGVPWWRNVDDDSVDGFVRSQKGGEQGGDHVPPEVRARLGIGRSFPATTWHWQFLHGKPFALDWKDPDEPGPEAPPAPPKKGD